MSFPSKEETGEEEKTGEKEKTVEGRDQGAEWRGGEQRVSIGRRRRRPGSKCRMES